MHVLKVVSSFFWSYSLYRKILTWIVYQPTELKMFGLKKKSYCLKMNDF